MDEQKKESFIEKGKRSFADWRAKRKAQNISQERESAELKSAIENARVEERKIISGEQKEHSIQVARVQEREKNNLREELINKARQQEREKASAPERRNEFLKSAVEKAKAGAIKFFNESMKEHKTKHRQYYAKKVNSKQLTDVNDRYEYSRLQRNPYVHRSTHRHTRRHTYDII